VAEFLRILNIGNTHVQAFDSPDGATFVSGPRVPTPDFDPERERRFLPSLAVSSVVPALTRRFRDFGAFLVSGTVRLPFEPSGLDLSTVGADRLANAAALLDGPLPALAIDFGTAITFEFVSVSRKFEGGVIMPGRQLLRNALHDHTAQLPLIPLSDSLAELPAENTVDAMRIGTDSAAVHAVGGLIHSIREYCAPGSLRIVACGGDRKFFLKHIGGMSDGGDFFTIRGIRKLWEFDHAG